MTRKDIIKIEQVEEKFLNFSFTPINKNIIFAD